MYSKEFCYVYNEYGWDYFSITMGDAIMKYFNHNKINIKTHLDLACGTGTLCNFFYNNNIKTSGIDISKDMIKIAREKNKNIDFQIKDMITYKSNSKYDLITITCDAVNHILNEEDLDQMFKNIYDMLNYNGYLIFDIYDEDNLELNTNIISNRDNGVIVNYYITEKKNLINTNVKIMKNNDLVFEYNVLEKLYDKEFMIKLLEKYNFKINKIGNKIYNEEQRFKDKIYFICTK